MGKTRVVLNNKGFDALRTSGEVVALVQAEAEAMAHRAGPGYAPLRPAAVGSTKRAWVAVGPVTRQAVREEARHHRLLGAING